MTSPLDIGQILQAAAAGVRRLDEKPLDRDDANEMVSLAGTRIYAGLEDLWGHVKAAASYGADTLTMRLDNEAIAEVIRDDMLERGFDVELELGVHQNLIHIGWDAKL